MLDKFNLNAKPVAIYAYKGNYEGNDYFKAVCELDTGIKLQTKLTAFEYQTLKTMASK